MKQRLILLFVLLISLSGHQTHAKPMEIEPGLWEHSLRMTSTSGQMEEAMRQMGQQLDALPPAQRQMLEQMMAAQGMSFGKDETVFRLCITAEDIARNELHLADENCTQQIIERTGDTIYIRFTCSGAPPPAAKAGSSSSVPKNTPAPPSSTLNWTENPKPSTSGRKPA